MIEILWHGRGGQGAFTAARLLGAAASMEDGAYALAFPSFGPERRGAPMRAFTKMSDAPIGDRSAISTADFVIYLDDTLLAPGWERELKPGGMALVNSARSTMDLLAAVGGPDQLLAVDADGLSEELLGRPIPNTVFLGSLSLLCDRVPLDAVSAAVLQYMAPKLHDKNLAIIDKARHATAKALVDRAEARMAAGGPDTDPELAWGMEAIGAAPSAAEHAGAVTSVLSAQAPRTGGDPNGSQSGSAHADAVASLRAESEIPRLRTAMEVAGGAPLPSLDPDVFARTTCYRAGHLVARNAGWRNVRPMVDAYLCTGCLQCYLYCPDGTIVRTHATKDQLSASDSDLAAVAVDYDFCKGCGICAKVCRFDAIAMVPEQEALAAEAPAPVDSAATPAIAERLVDRSGVVEITGPASVASAPDDGAQVRARAAEPPEADEPRAITPEQAAAVEQMAAKLMAPPDSRKPQDSAAEEDASGMPSAATAPAEDVGESSSGADSATLSDVIKERWRVETESLLQRTPGVSRETSSTRAAHARSAGERLTAAFLSDYEAAGGASDVDELPPNVVRGRFATAPAFVGAAASRVRQEERRDAATPPDPDPEIEAEDGFEPEAEHGFELGAPLDSGVDEHREPPAEQQLAFDLNPASDPEESAAEYDVAAEEDAAGSGYEVAVAERVGAVDYPAPDAEDVVAGYEGVDEDEAPVTGYDDADAESSLAADYAEPASYEDYAEYAAPAAYADIADPYAADPYDQDPDDYPDPEPARPASPAPSRHEDLSAEAHDIFSAITRFAAASSAAVAQPRPEEAPDLAPEKDPPDVGPAQPEASASPAPSPQPPAPAAPPVPPRPVAVVTVSYDDAPRGTQPHSDNEEESR